eukprot:154935-Chlamydomonas_euryale.AAC.1
MALLHSLSSPLLHAAPPSHTFLHRVLRWRTALIIRELELEIDALAAGRSHTARLKRLMAKKEAVGSAFNQLRLARQRAAASRAGAGAAAGSTRAEATVATG